MFEGTSLWFKIPYFITAMTPAYLLFILQVQIDKHSRLINYGLVLIIFLVAILLGFGIKRLLFSRKETGITDNDYKLRIENKNGDIITFIFGVIIPSVLISSEISLLEQFVVFIGIQIISYTVVMRSSTVFPNIVLLLLGIDVYAVENNEFIFTIHQRLKKNQKFIQVHRLGDSRENNTFTLGEEK